MKKISKTIVLYTFPFFTENYNIKDVDDFSVHFLDDEELESYAFISDNKGNSVPNPGFPLYNYLRYIRSLIESNKYDFIITSCIKNAFIIRDIFLNINNNIHYISVHPLSIDEYIDTTITKLYTDGPEMLLLGTNLMVLSTYRDFLNNPINSELCDYSLYIGINNDTLMLSDLFNNDGSLNLSNKSDVYYKDNSKVAIWRS